MTSCLARFVFREASVEDLDDDASTYVLGVPSHAQDLVVRVMDLPFREATAVDYDARVPSCKTCASSLESSVRFRLARRAPQSPCVRIREAPVLNLDARRRFRTARLRSFETSLTIHNTGRASLETGARNLDTCVPPILAPRNPNFAPREQSSEIRVQNGERSIEKQGTREQGFQRRIVSHEPRFECDERCERNLDARIEEAERRGPRRAPCAQEREARVVNHAPRVRDVAPRGENRPIHVVNRHPCVVNLDARTVNLAPRFANLAPRVVGRHTRGANVDGRIVERDRRIERRDAPWLALEGGKSLSCRRFGKRAPVM